MLARTLQLIIIVQKRTRVRAAVRLVCFKRRKKLEYDSATLIEVLRALCCVRYAVLVCCVRCVLRCVLWCAGVCAGAEDAMLCCVVLSGAEWGCCSGNPASAQGEVQGACAARGEHVAGLSACSERVV